MRVVRRSRWWAAGAVALIALLVVSGATGAQPRKVQLNITLTGMGTVHLDGRRQLVCQTYSVCKRTFLVAAGAKVALTAQAAREWRFTHWTHGCRGTLRRCSLRVKRATSVGATFAPAP